jgi:GntR family transcriptional regulator
MTLPDHLGGPLDRESPMPIFAQIRERLEDAIAQGALQPNQRIPSERQLSDQFGVSRMTVRQAVDAITRDRLLYSRPGQGTFVAEPNVIEQPLRHLTSFSEDILGRGMQPSSQVLHQEVIPASFELAGLFGLPPTIRVARVRRLRLIDDEPVAIETVHIPEQFVPGLLDRDLAVESLYEILRSDYGLELVSARQTIQAATASPDEMTHLRMDGPDPVLKISRLTFDAKERLVEFVQSIYRGDRYHLTVELR